MQNVQGNGLVVCKLDVAQMKDMYVASKVLGGLDARRRRTAKKVSKMAIVQRNGLVKFTSYQLIKTAALILVTAETADVAKALDTRASPKMIIGLIAMPVAPKGFGKQTIQITRLSGVAKSLISPHIQIAPLQTRLRNPPWQN